VARVNFLTNRSEPDTATTGPGYRAFLENNCLCGPGCARGVSSALASGRCQEFKRTGLPIYFVMAAMEASSSKNGPRSGQEQLPEGKWSSGVAGIIIVLFEPFHAYPPRLERYDRLLPAV
jgi:hypothetical protein